MITVPKTICNEMNEYFVIIRKKLGVQMNNTKDKTYINSLGKRQVERRASDHKVAGLMPVLGITSLCPWERHLTLIF